MSKIPIRKNKKGTFLDLTKENISEFEFKNTFADFTEEISSFLSGSSVSLMVSHEDARKIDEHSSLLEMMKSELNRNNISLTTIMSETKEIFNDEASRASAERHYRMKNETEAPVEDKELIDTSELPETLYVEANLRSGQLIRYPGNVFIMGDINPSAEVIAAGDIVVWGALRGIAHAGANGNTNAKIVAMDISAGQIRIANQVRDIGKAEKQKKGLFQQKDKGKGDSRTPELVKIENGEIIVTRFFG